MTVQLAVTILLVLVALAATFYVRRAAAAIIVTRDEQTALRKHTKEMLTSAQRTDATAKRILDRAYKYQSQIDVLMMDPKVQAALNRHNREVS